MKLFEDANINVPLGNLYKKAIKEGTYDFETPLDAYVIGNQLCNTHLKSSQLISIDLAVEMNQTFFTERDYLNYRYFMKRSLYTSHIYLQLMNTKRFSKIKYEFIADYSTMHKPALCLIFKGKSFVQSFLLRF